LHALNTVAGTLAALAAAVRTLGEVGPLAGELRPDIEKLARDLLDVRRCLLEIPILGC
jgi:hypothetical protein